MASADTRYVPRPDPARDGLTADAERHLRDLVDGQGFGVEGVLYGCASEARADEWRRAFKRAGRRLGVSVWSVWHYCEGPDCGGGHRYCQLAGEPGCTWHVHYRAHRPEDAARFMAAKAKTLGWPQRGRKGCR
jgi:hypothetical protein